MKKLLIYAPVIFTLAIAAFLPAEVAAQAPFVQCEGVGPGACSACDLAVMGNNIVTWLIGVIFVLFAVILAIAGWGLVTSGGNVSAKQAAKDKFVNAFIGFLIVLGAWILIDTIMRGVLTTADGTIEGYGPWSEVQCQSQTRTEVVVERAGDTTTSAPVACSSDPTGNNTACGSQIASCEDKGGTANVDSSDPSTHYVTCDTPVGVSASVPRELCDPGPGGGNVVCTNQVQSCEASGGTPTVDDSDPSNYYVECTPAGPTGGACNESEMVTANVLGRSRTVHQSIASQVEAATAEWESQGGDSYYNVYSVGTYNCRRVTGGSSWSIHAYGLAIDVNPRDNGYVKPRPSGGCPTNMPSSFVGIYKGRGFGWGGDWTSLCDAMHFSGARKEGGWINI